MAHHGPLAPQQGPRPSEQSVTMVTPQWKICQVSNLACESLLLLFLFFLKHFQASCLFPVTTQSFIFLIFQWVLPLSLPLLPLLATLPSNPKWLSSPPHQPSKSPLCCLPISIDLQQWLISKDVYVYLFLSFVSDGFITIINRNCLRAKMLKQRESSSQREFWIGEENEISYIIQLN